MNVAAATGNSGVEALVNKLDREAKLITIESKRTGKIGHAENGRDVRKTTGSFGHGGRGYTSNETEISHGRVSWQTR
jgi:hypothetical protein